MDTLQMFDNGLQSTDVMNPSRRRLTSFTLRSMPRNTKPAGRRVAARARYQRIRSTLTMYHYTHSLFSDNPHKYCISTPLPAAALLFATLPAYSLTGKREGGVA